MAGKKKMTRRASAKGKTTNKNKTVRKGAAAKPAGFTLNVPKALAATLVEKNGGIRKAKEIAMKAVENAAG